MDVGRRTRNRALHFAHPARTSANHPVHGGRTRAKGRCPTTSRVLLTQNVSPVRNRAWFWGSPHPDPDLIHSPVSETRVWVSEKTLHCGGFRTETGNAWRTCKMISDWQDFLQRRTKRACVCVIGNGQHYSDNNTLF